MSRTNVWSEGYLRELWGDLSALKKKLGEVLDGQRDRCYGCERVLAISGTGLLRCVFQIIIRITFQAESMLWWWKSFFQKDRYQGQGPIRQLAYLEGIGKDLDLLLYAPKEPSSGLLAHLQFCNDKLAWVLLWPSRVISGMAKQAEERALPARKAGKALASAFSAISKVLWKSIEVSRADRSCNRTTMRVF